MSLFHKKNKPEIISNPYKQRIAGPFITKSGNLQGHTLTIETQLLEILGTKEQKEQFKKLSEENIIMAKEYLLRVTGAYDTWEKNIKELITTFKELEQKIKELRKKEITVEQAYNDLIKIIEETRTLQEKEPKYYEKIRNQLINNLEQEEETIKMLEKKLTEMKKNLLKGLEELNQDFPFFFKERIIKAA